MSSLPSQRPNSVATEHARDSRGCTNEAVREVREHSPVLPLPHASAEALEDSRGRGDGKARVLQGDEGTSDESRKEVLQDRQKQGTSPLSDLEFGPAESSDSRRIVQSGSVDAEGANCNVDGMKLQKEKFSAMRSILGLLCAALGAISFALLSLFVELTIEHFGNNAILLICARAVVQLIIGVVCFCVERWVRNRWRRSGSSAEKGEEGKDGGLLGPPKDRFFLFSRGALASLSVGCLFFALSQMSMGDVSAIFFSSPFITAFLARVWLKETGHWLYWVAGVVSVVGVLFIARPSFLSNVLFEPLGIPPPVSDAHDVSTVSRPVAAMIVVVGAITASVGFTIVRKIPKVSLIPNVVWISIMSFVFSFVLMLSWKEVRPSLSDLEKIPLLEGWGGAVLIGATGFAGQLLLTLGLQLEKAGPASFTFCLEVVAAFVFQALVMHTPVGIGSVVGGLLVVLAATMLFGIKLWVSRGHAESILTPGSAPLPESSRASTSTPQSAPVFRQPDELASGGSGRGERGGTRREEEGAV
uniref:EamA domain-containing protein n=1 Tax=Chromera velia CCMP2878 TaxID=1169474 RepID=A0A0G4HHU0_9ALVE|eukprot:Cvel_27608.t1-p1 / transcript=Cvel_27608.t1 / gene=Cvel_27608 / organism=Chromera_velia_CCMP2878 / gene_product=Solute carrier family 35 member G1, putative / transcript_product=Solute carrier family 35 member G1, putative / location=Cvel_scaffold3473:2106-4423(+) / protein_length=528 / sequence_SO=supercontig / SO=protein_coding / is_pseudo=false